MQPINVLVFAANPFQTRRLALDEEVRDIEMGLRATPLRSSIRVVVRWAARPDDLLDALNDVDPTIVHFSGHGTQRSLVFHADTGEASQVSSKALSLVFRAMAGNVRVVLLNACYSAPQARTLSKFVDCVVGMKASISDEAARLFAASFYRAIGYGKSVKNAFDQGVASIAAHNIPHDAAPAILAASGVKPSKLFLLNTDVHRQLFTYDEHAASNATSAFESTVDIRASDGREFISNRLPYLVEQWRGDVSALLLDIDDLSVINKRFGAPVGDRIIATLYELLALTDTIQYSGRCGDDTFYAIMLSTDRRKAEEFARSLAQFIVDFNWEAIAVTLHVSCSFGIAQWGFRESVTDWIVRAAQGLITAKRDGSGSICFGPAFLPITETRRDHWQYFS